MTTITNEIDHCEVCGNRQIVPVIDLGRHPMCDDLVSVTDSRVCAEYPIAILYCKTCRTAHQRFQIPKTELFPKTYHYRSRFTADVLNGMKGLVESCEQRFGPLSGKKVLDIGCNDGSLLGFFRERGASTFGIEPTGAAADAIQQGHVVLNTFLTESSAAEIADRHGRPDLVVFTNVFAHIEDLGEVVRALRRLMSEKTVIVIENHYLGAVLDGNQFDTFYHEHPRTYSCTSFVHIAKSLGLSICNVEFPSRYGGNIRVCLGPVDPRNTACDVEATLRAEEQFFAQFGIMKQKMECWRENKRAEIKRLVAKHGKLRAKAFPGRAAILIKLLGLDQDLILEVHEKPGSMKIGHFVPGTRIPIVSDDVLFAAGDRTAPLLNLAWHIGGEIRRYLSAHAYAGPVIDIIEPGDFAKGA